MRPVRLNQTRRALLLRSAKVAGLVALTAVVGSSTPAAAKAAKSDFMYQDHRRDKKSCGQCKFFSPDGPNSDIGSCSIVEGAISREGWCAAFVPKILA
jgi:hypothetical protein